MDNSLQFKDVIGWWVLKTMSFVVIQESELQKSEFTADGKGLELYLKTSGSKQYRKNKREDHTVACSFSFIHAVCQILIWRI